MSFNQVFFLQRYIFLPISESPWNKGRLLAISANIHPIGKRKIFNWGNFRSSKLVVFLKFWFHEIFVVYLNKIRVFTYGPDVNGTRIFIWSQQNFWSTIPQCDNLKQQNIHLKIKKKDFMKSKYTRALI